MPFQIFDRAARTLPGSVISFGIDTMVAVIHGLQIGETSSVAKTAEQTMAIGWLLVGTLAGALVFSISWPEAGRWQSPRIVLGLLLGVPAASIAASVEQPSGAGPIVDGARYSWRSSCGASRSLGATRVVLRAIGSARWMGDRR